MYRKMILGVFITVIIIALSAWSPWLTQSFVETRAVDSFNHSWTTVVDGCGTNCKGCGAIHSKRVPFGMEVTLEYGCGLIARRYISVSPTSNWLCFSVRDCPWFSETIRTVF